MSSLKTRKFFATFTFFLFALLVGLILFMRPWWGLMDDWSLIRMCPRLTSHFFQTTLEYMREDIGRGALRPTYPLLILGLYCYSPDPIVLYVLNAAFVFLILYFLGVALQKSIGRSLTPEYPFGLVFVIFSLCFFRTHDLFLHPSLQEKLVLLVGALSLDLFSDDRRMRRIGRGFYPISLILLASGFLSKPQFVTFIPALGLLLLSRTQRSKDQKERDPWGVRLFFFAAISLVFMVVLKRIANQGVYTSSYQYSKVWANLFQKETGYLLALMALSFFAELSVLRGARASGRGGADLCRVAIPASFLLAYLALFLPWSVGDTYLMAYASPFMAFCLLSFLSLYPKSLLRIAVLGSLLLATAMTAYRGYRNFARLGDIRKIIYSEELHAEVSKGPAEMVVPCPEGSAAMAYYFQRFSQDLLPVTQAPDTRGAPNKRVFYFGDSALCPMAPPPGFHALTQPRFAGSFAVYTR